MAAFAAQPDGLSSADLVARVAAIIGEAAWAKWQRWWLKHLRLHPEEAWDALRQTATADALGRSGRGDRVNHPGKFFNARFRELAGLQPSNGGGQGR